MLPSPLQEPAPHGFFGIWGQRNQLIRVGFQIEQLFFAWVELQDQLVPLVADR
jgi:hypothetical protein